jgi:hypothetical protein
MVEIVMHGMLPSAKGAGWKSLGQRPREIPTIIKALKAQNLRRTEQTS